MTLLSNILFRVTRHQFVKGSCCIEPIDNLWSDFLASPDFKAVMEGFESARDEGDHDNDGDDDLSQWIEVLDEACYIWKVLVHDDDDDDDDDDSVSLSDQADKEDGDEMKLELWKTICFLMKGVFYLANNVSLSQLANEPTHQFLLHAATGSLPLCSKNDDDSEKHLIIFERALKLHKDQLSIAGPVLNRLPLHIAAANKCSPVNLSDLPSRVLPSADRNLNVEIMSTVLTQSPPSAASVADAQGNYPIHLACANGYSWIGGLENLYSAAPDVAKAGNLPCLFVLMAQNTKQEDSHKMKKGGAPKWMRSSRTWLRSRKHKVKHPTRNEDMQELNTVFQLFQSDPEIVLSAVAQ